MPQPKRYTPVEGHGDELTALQALQQHEHVQVGDLRDALEGTHGVLLGDEHAL